MVVWCLVGCGLLELVMPSEEDVTAEEIEFADPLEVEDGLEIPSTPPTMGEPIAEGGAKEVVPAPAPEKWNPVSMPQGQREGGGVRWEGVKKKGPPSHLRGPERFNPDNAN